MKRSFWETSVPQLMFSWPKKEAEIKQQTRKKENWLFIAINLSYLIPLLLLIWLKTSFTAGQCFVFSM